MRGYVEVPVSGSGLNGEGDGSPSRRFPLRLVGALVLLIAVATVLVPGSALALKSHVLQATFGSAGAGDGQFELVASNNETGVAGSGVAVSEATHDVYVADTGNHRVDQFSASGAFIRAFGADVGGVGVDVCTSGCLAGTPGGSPGAFEAPTFIAIDNSASSASKGDVYVADAANRLVSKFDASGALISAWGAGGQLDGSSAAGGPFGEHLAGIAVDSVGNLDVFQSEPHLLFRFAQDSSFIEDLETPRGTTPAGLAVDPSGNLFKVNGDRSVEKLESFGGDVGQLSITSGVTPTSGLAVDASNGELFVDRGSSIDNYAFEPSGEVVGTGCTPAPASEEFLGCHPTSTFGAGSLTAGAGLAVDGSSHTVVATDPGAARIAIFAPVLLPDATTEPANPVGATTATLNGTVSAAGGPDATCHFEYASEEAFNSKGFEGALTAPCVPGGPFTGSTVDAVIAQISELSSGVPYFFRVAASSENGSNPSAASTIGALKFQTLGASVGFASVSRITASSATVAGPIDPNGEPTSFAVEYVKQADFLQSGFARATSVPASPRPVGSASEFLSVAQQLTDLDPGTTYYVRLAATTGVATSHGGEVSFSTYAREGTRRAYEMVSPAQKIGEAFPPEAVGNLGGTCIQCLPGFNDITMPMQSAPDGDTLAFEGEPFSTGLAPSGNEYLSRRSEDGWATASISSLLSARDGESGFKAFAPDLSRAVLFQRTTALSTEVPPGENGQIYNDLYLWEAGSPLRPLVTQKPPHRVAGASAINGFELSFATANSGTAQAPAFSHLVFSANDALTPAVPGIAPAAPEVEEGPCGASGGGGHPFTEGNCNFYEWLDGRLRLVNVLPGNTTTAAHAVIGSGWRLAEVPGSESAPESQAADVDHAISADGTRIFWSDEHGQVFVRIDGKETKEVHDPGQFLTASADGSKVLLSDGCLYDVEAGTCESLSAGPSGFLGILGASEDLSRIYFIDTEALAPGAQAGSCEAISSDKAQKEEEEEGKVPAGTGCNLYAYDNGSISFVATLLERDNNFGPDGLYGAWKASRSNRTAQVSADGRHLAFMTTARLTGYDSRHAGGGNCGHGPCFEVFEYDSDSKSLTCASCNPTGQRPLGASNLSLIRYAFGASFPQPENLPAEGGGRLFFESQDVLTPKDTNGHIQDVYEWKPDGLEGCESTKGCLALISSGHSANDSMFLNATPNGDNAFFVTREQLLPQDKDELLDVYDARIGGGISVGETVPCGGEACRGPISGLVESSGPGSSSFSGPGNLVSAIATVPLVKSKPLTRAQKLAVALKACAKKPKSKRRICEAQARKRYGPLKAKSKTKATAKTKGNSNSKAHQGGK